MTAPDNPTMLSHLTREELERIALSLNSQLQCAGRQLEHCRAAHDDAEARLARARAADALAQQATIDDMEKHRDQDRRDILDLASRLARARAANAPLEAEVERLTHERDEACENTKSVRAVFERRLVEYGDRIDAAEARLARARNALAAYDKAVGLDELLHLAELRRALADSEPAANKEPKP